MRRIFFLNNRLHPVWRAVVYFAGVFSGLVGFTVVIVLVWAAAQVLFSADPNSLSAQAAALANSPAFLLISSALNLGWSLLLAFICLRWLDGAPFTSLGFQRTDAGRELVLGLAVGTGSMLVVFGVLFALGWVRVQGTALVPRPAPAVSLLLALVLAAAFEEVVFRGYLLRTLLEWRGWGMPLAATSVAFGLVHLGNPNVTGLALFNIMLAGAAFALGLKLTGRLWLPMAYHFAWNFTQGPLLGLSVSGLSFPTLLTTTLTGPEVWTGGAFGPEGGLIVTGILLVSVGLFFALDRRRQAAG
jgi:membrane protease YdiL (CAAX protease family)